jgi:beta-mannosidase
MTNFSVAQNELRWEFYHPKKQFWMSFGTSGSIQEKLIDSGELPNPFIGCNEEQFAWIEDEIWQLKSRFYLTEKEFNSTSLKLNFPNIDTYADVFLNGEQIYSAVNFFHPHTIEVKNRVICGYNEIKLVFTPPIRFHEKRFENDPFKYPAPNDPNKIKAAPLTRKPQYQFGWDWALRMNTIGLSKPARIEIGKENEILSCVVSTKEISGNSAWVTYRINLSNYSIGFRLVSNFLGVISEEDVTIKKEGFQVDLKINDAKLWWPRGYGEQNLYLDTLRIFDGNQQLIDEKTVRFGIRKAELVQQKDQWGTSYQFVVNEVPIFCKGANYIPQSVFPAFVKDVEIVGAIDQMVAANFNMVRVWGGGYYPDDIFFQTCDEKGIMIWQDFMFACAMYPGDSAFLSSVKTELIYQVPRIAAHPSVILFNGNNEVDVAWKNWGFQSQYNLDEANQKVIEKAYADLFKTLIPNVVSAYSKTMYVHTSPLSNWGKDEFYNHGSQHYWGVWHGKDPMSDFAKKIGRFNAEYGFQSFPEFSTLLAFSKKEDWDLNSKVMKHHQKSYVGNQMIKKHADLLYGTTDDFNRFVYLSQLTQAYAVSSAVTGHRLDAPRCSGTIFWQLNDCWPAPTWSSIDFYGNWKALHYAIRDDYRDLALLKQATEQGEIIWVKSDLKEKQKANIKIETFSLVGKLVDVKEIPLEINFQDHIEIWNHSKAKFSKDVLIRVSIDSVYYREFLISSKKTFAKPTVNLKLENVNPSTKTFELKVLNSAFCADFWVYSMKQGIRFERNFINLLPGTHTVKGTYSELPKLSDFGYLFR